MPTIFIVDMAGPAMVHDLGWILVPLLHLLIILSLLRGCEEEGEVWSEDEGEGLEWGRGADLAYDVGGLGGVGHKKMQ